MAKAKTVTTTQAHQPDIQATAGFMVAVANYDSDTFRVVGIYSSEAAADPIFASIEPADNQATLLIPVLRVN